MSCSKEKMFLRRGGGGLHLEDRSVCSVWIISLSTYQNPNELQRTAGQLDCWTVGLLDSWTAGQLDCWTAELLDSWTAGQLECWSVLTNSVQRRPEYIQQQTIISKPYYIILCYIVLCYVILYCIVFVALTLSRILKKKHA